MSNQLVNIARGIAKNRMKRAGIQHICKHISSGSFFSKNWRAYVHREGGKK